MDEKIVQEWKGELKIILDGYDKKNIINADNTGLFYNMVGNKTFTYKNEVLRKTQFGSFSCFTVHKFG